jgi:putative peptidoglycan lipid II flippase
MIVLREPLASVFFEYGLFDASSAARTASALAWFAIGVPAHVVVHVLARAFYAMQDTWTPVAWAVVAVAVNILLMVALVDPYGVEGLALALSVSATVEVIGLLVALRRRLGRLDGRVLLSSVARSSAATLVAAGVMFLALGFLSVAGSAVGLQSGGAVTRLVLLLVPAALGGAAYLATAFVLRAPELDVIRRLVSRGRPSQG